MSFFVHQAPSVGDLLDGFDFSYCFWDSSFSRFSATKVGRSGSRATCLVVIVVVIWFMSRSSLGWSWRTGCLFCGNWCVLWSRLLFRSAMSLSYLQVGTLVVVFGSVRRHKIVLDPNMKRSLGPASCMSSIYVGSRCRDGRCRRRTVRSSKHIFVQVTLIVPSWSHKSMIVQPALAKGHNR